MGSALRVDPKNGRVGDQGEPYLWLGFPLKFENTSHKLFYFSRFSDLCCEISATPQASQSGIDALCHMAHHVITYLVTKIGHKDALGKGRCRSSYKVFSDLLRKQYTKQQTTDPSPNNNRAA